MTELDFEELDKAVNDLMTDSNISEVAAPQAPALDQVVPSPSVTAPLVAPSESVVAPVANSLATKRRGQFMDMVRTPTPAGQPAPAPLTPVSRDGATIPAPAPDNSASVGENQPAAPEEPEQTGDYASHPGSATDWSSFNEPAEAEQPAAEASVDNTAIEPSEATEPIEPVEQLEAPAVEAVEPLAEPVISDEPVASEEPALEAETVSEPAETAPEAAEVEAPVEPTEELATIVQPEQPVEPAADTAMESPFLPDTKVEKRPLGGTASGEDQANTDAPLPRELSSDLMNIDSDPNKPHSQPAPVADGAEPSIFAQAPLAPAPKKKHGWLILVWILVLLIVGACAGAAYFYFTTQR